MNSWANLTAACPKSWDKLKLFCENDEKKCFPQEEADEKMGICT